MLSRPKFEFHYHKSTSPSLVGVPLADALPVFCKNKSTPIPRPGVRQIKTKDCHLLPKDSQWSATICRMIRPIDLTLKSRPGDNCHGWSLTPHLLKDGHPISIGWLNTTSKMVIHHPQYGHPPFQGCSATITRLVTHHPKDCDAPS